MLWLPPCRFKDTSDVLLLSLDPPPEHKQSQAGDENLRPGVLQSDLENGCFRAAMRRGVGVAQQQLFIIRQYSLPDSRIRSRPYGNSPLCTQMKRVRAAGSSF